MSYDRMAVTGKIDFLGLHDSSLIGKPYSLKYNPTKEFPLTNIVSESCEQTLQDVRGHEDDFNVTENGFALLRLMPRLTYEEYDDKAKVETIYYRQVAEGVKRLLNASRVQIFEHVVSDPFEHRGTSQLTSVASQTPYTVSNRYWRAL